MHENREISCTSWSADQDRSAKAINRAADAYVQEKSDCAAIPVNQPNNERQLSAEAGEGRAQTQENTVQSHMRPTQSGKRMSQGLRGVRQAARERKQERFTALLHHLSVGLLCDSFYALKHQASPGVDGVTWQEYETGLEDRLVDLHSRVHRGAYRARPSRRVYIPKADGRQRPLGIAALEDKIVQGRSFRRWPVVGDEAGYAAGSSGFAVARQRVPTLRVRSMGRGLAQESREG